MRFKESRQDFSNEKGALEMQGIDTMLECFPDFLDKISCTEEEKKTTKLGPKARVCSQLHKSKRRESV